MTVGFAWWTPASGGSQQAFVQNVRGLDAVADGVDVYTDRSLDAMLASAADFDWALVPFVFDPGVVSALAAKTHVHLQIGGCGRNDWDAAERAVTAADSVSVLDPQLAEPFGVPDAPWIPNPPNPSMFQPSPGGEYVLVPKQHPQGGLGGAREQVAEYDGDVVVLGGSFDAPENVTIKPKQPLSWMPRLYRDAAAVVNPCEREGLPNVAFEAFLTGTPYVAVEQAGIGVMQATEHPWPERAGDAVSELRPGGTGDHYVRNLAEADESVGLAGRAWVEAWVGTDWDWAAKMRAIERVVG